MLLSLLAPTVLARTDAWDAFERPTFERLTALDGLPHDTVSALAQDSWGMIWIGTFGGVARYDGYRMTVLSSAGLGHACQLRDGYIRSLFALPQGRMLVGLNAGGVARYDGARRCFDPVQVEGGGPALSKIFHMSASADGQVWVAAEEGLYRYQPSSGTLRQVPLDGLPSAQSRRVFRVMEDEAGALWIGANPGLWRRGKGEADFKRIPLRRGEQVVGDLVWSMYVDRRKRMWIGTGTAGVVVREPDGMTWTPRGMEGDSPALTGRTIRDFAEQADGRIWIATDGIGMLRASEDGRSFEIVRAERANNTRLPGDAVRQMFTDRTGNLWFATDLGAARQLEDGLVATTLGPVSDQVDLGARGVSYVFTDRDGQVWVGLNGGGVAVLDPARGTARKLDLPAAASSQNVRAIAQAPDGRIWLGAQGVLAVDPQTLQVHGQVHASLKDIRVLAIEFDGVTALLGSYDGVVAFDTVRHRLHRIGYAPGRPDSLVNAQVQAIGVLEGRRWYATIGGLSVQRAGDARLENYVHDPEDIHSLPQDYVTKPVWEPARRRAWIGTYQGLAWIDGLNRQGRLRFNALPPQDLRVDAIVIDTANDLWLSSSSGVRRVSHTNLAMQQLGRRDGLDITAFAHDVGALGPGGEVLFGGPWGLTVIRPERARNFAQDASSLALAITSVTARGAVMSVQRGDANHASIRLRQNQRDVSVDFSLMDYRAPRQTRYAYRLLGLDDTWIDVPLGVAPSAVFTNLPGGDFTLELRATTHGLRSRVLEAAFPLQVERRWYETTIARIGMVLLLMLLVVGVAMAANLVSRRRANRLRVLVEARTSELRIANERLGTLANTDSLTGLLTRRRTLELAEDAFAQALQAGTPLSVIMLDIDHFKRINDTYGHAAGDAVLVECAQCARGETRGGDLVGRYGGEEFILVLPQAAAQGASDFAERLRLCLTQLRIAHGEAEIAVTASLGVATLESGDATLPELIHRADEALYVAKREGRDRMHFIARES